MPLRDHNPWVCSGPGVLLRVRKWPRMMLRSMTEVRRGVVVLRLAGTLNDRTYQQVRDAVINVAVDAAAPVIVDVNGLDGGDDGAWVVFTSARWHVKQWPEVPIALVSGDRRARPTGGSFGLCPRLRRCSRSGRGNRRRNAPLPPPRPRVVRRPPRQRERRPDLRARAPGGLVDARQDSGCLHCDNRFRRERAEPHRRRIRPSAGRRRQRTGRRGLRFQPCLGGSTGTPGRALPRWSGHRLVALWALGQYAGTQRQDGVGAHRARGHLRRKRRAVSPAGASGGVVEDQPERVTLAGSDHGQAVPHRRGRPSPRRGHRPVPGGEEVTVALRQLRCGAA